MARLQNEVGTKDFFRGTNFLTKNAPKFSPKFSSLYFVGPKKSRKIPAKFPAKFPSQKSKKFHWRASAGAPGENFTFFWIKHDQFFGESAVKSCSLCWHCMRAGKYEGSGGGGGTLSEQALVGGGRFAARWDLLQAGLTHARTWPYCGALNHYALVFIIFEMFTVLALQCWGGWGIFAVIPGYPRRANGDSQHAQNYRIGPCSNYLPSRPKLLQKSSLQK